MDKDLKAFLEPGDVLLYKGSGFFSGLIFLKTWHTISHCEAYVGDGQSVASRDGIGVGLFPFRSEGLVSVFRPKEFEPILAWSWFETVKGQKYDWVGLLRFAWFKSVPSGNNKKMFCSEFLTRFLRAGGCDPFPREDADAVAPYQFSITPALDLILQTDKE